ncbi:MAG TPA: hypothetical protein VHP31_08425 [Caproicibacter sp.]|nr:hypothetical protein [Caproicibacter sp.]
MKKYRLFSCLIIAVLFVIAFPVTTFADSSWVWISKTRPNDVLPWAAAITLIVEVAAINYIPKVHKLPKVFCIVTLANALSFAAPYLINYMVFVDEGFGFDKYLNNWPSYTVGIYYGIITIAVELPVVYNTLKKDVTSKRKLLLTIIIANVVTTVIVACFERIFCRGTW